MKYYFSQINLFCRRITDSAVLLLLLSLFAAGCVKNDEPYSPQEGTVYMPQAYQERSKLTIYRIEEPQTATFGFAYAGFAAAPTDITGEFEVAPELVAIFNTENAYLGYSYTVLPEDAYSIPALSTMIKQGETSSTPLSIIIEANKLDKDTRYMLPVKLVSVSSGNIKASLSVTYFIIDEIQIRSRDVTLPATITVANENSGGSNAGEGSPKLVDGDITTKFLSTFNGVPSYWMQLQEEEAKVLNAYSLTSGNDAPGRDPKTWQFLGSNNGTDWVVLDEREDYVFSGRRETVMFELNQPDGNAYSYYRLVVVQNGGESLFQMSEWRLLQFY